MPTPFYHLSVAEELVGLARLSPRARALLLAERSAFLFGNTAPDVQVISRQARPDTHFFDLPVRSVRRPPWEQLLAAHPSLGQAARLPPAQAAFLAGYLCHLQADWLWVKDIFVPVFGLHSAWGTFPQRLYLHNVLRAYQDRQITPSLTNGTCASLARAAPADWLPFVRDEHLRQWRDLLVSQLHPEAPSQTVEVFAARQGLSPDEFYRLLDSEDGMEREVFARVPRHSLDLYRQRLIEGNINLLEMYVGSIGDESH